jgi:hypothetical protein
MLTPLSAATRPTGTETRLNGIQVTITQRTPTAVTDDVPSLGVEVSATGPLAKGVLATLTYSPRAVVLADGPELSVPSSWKWVSFAGVRFAAPRSWPQRTINYYGEVCGYLVIDDDVTMSTDAEPPPVVFCPVEPYSSNVQAQRTGVRIDAVLSRATSTPTGLSTRRMHIHGLTACPYASPGFNLLCVRVSGQHLAHPVMVEVALAGDGSIGRTILGSLQAA